MLEGVDADLGVEVVGDSGDDGVDVAGGDHLPVVGVEGRVEGVGRLLLLRQDVAHGADAQAGHAPGGHVDAHHRMPQRYQGGGHAQTEFAQADNAEADDVSHGWGSLVSHSSQVVGGRPAAL